MLTYKVASAPQHEEFLQLMRVDAADYLEYSLRLMRLTWQEFADLTRTVGQIYAIYQDENLVGFYWIEERGRILHLHGLFVKDSYQNQGIGTQVLNMLAGKYASSMEAIELGIHDSNPGARSLYEKLGFKIVKRLADLGFSVMQKPLSKKDDKEKPHECK
jgi:ribosomal protein S18 acetylase RimI-like enzyme